MLSVLSFYRAQESTQSFAKVRSELWLAQNNANSVYVPALLKLMFCKRVSFILTHPSVLVAQCLSQSVPNIYIFFTELEQKMLQFLWKHKRPQVAMQS